MIFLFDYFTYQAPVATPFWWDFAKAVIGPFLGASLAFASNAVWLRVKNRDDHLLAGNIALATLSRMIDAFIKYQERVYAERAKILKLVPHAPLWVQMKPIQYEFNVSLRLDIRSVSFLLKDKDTDILDDILHADELFSSLASLHMAHMQDMMALQTKMDEAPISKVDPPRFDREGFDILGAQVGWPLAKRVESLNTGILYHLERDQQILWSAAQKLRVALVREFGKKRVKKLNLVDSLVKSSTSY